METDNARTTAAAGGHSFLAAAVPTPDVDRHCAADLEHYGYVMNLTHLWAHQPALRDGWAGLVGAAADAAGLTTRDRGVMISAAAASIGDAYCSLAWGNRLAKAAGGAVAGEVIAGTDGGLDAREQALAAWARWVASDPNGTTTADVDALRAAEYTDEQIVAITVFVALRMAFSSVNDALGAAPDRQLVDAATAPVRDAVSFGRPPVGLAGGGSG